MTNLLSPPWWLTCLALAIGIVIWANGNKRTDARTRWIGIAVIMLGVVMGLLSFLIETDSQKVERQSKELVKAVVDQNWNGFQALLSPDATLAIQGLPPLMRSRDQIMAGAKAAAARYGLRSGRASIEDAKRQDYIISITLSVWTTGDVDAGRPLPSEWQLDWTKAANGQWVVTDIRAMRIGNTTGSDMSMFIPRVK